MMTLTLEEQDDFLLLTKQQRAFSAAASPAVPANDEQHIAADSIKHQCANNSVNNAYRRNNGLFETVVLTPSKPTVNLREVTSYSAKITWHLPPSCDIISCSNHSRSDGIAGIVDDDATTANEATATPVKYMFYFDIPGDSERFRLLYYGVKNRVKITGLRRATIYRFFVRAAVDARYKTIGTFGSFCTLPESRSPMAEPIKVEVTPCDDIQRCVKIGDSGSGGAQVLSLSHDKGWLAFSNPRERDETILMVPSFQAAMWSRRYCHVLPGIGNASDGNGTFDNFKSNEPQSPMKLDLEYAWQHYKWTAKENCWKEMKQQRFTCVLRQNLTGLKINERDRCNLELQEYSEEEDFHTVIKAAQKSGGCWRSADCIPCSIGCLHLCQSVSLVYWLSCDICGADYIGRTHGRGVTLADTLNGCHPWVRGHFSDCHPFVFSVTSNSQAPAESAAAVSNEEVTSCYDHVTGIVIQLFDPDTDEAVIKASMRKMVKHLRPTDNAFYPS